MVVEDREDLGLQELADGLGELLRAWGGRAPSCRLVDQVEQLVLHLGGQAAEDSELDATARARSGGGATASGSPSPT